MSEVKIYSNDNQTLVPVTLSESALHYVQQKINQRHQGIGVRLAVKSAGCSGLKYVFDYVDVADSKDYCFPTEDNHLHIYVDPQSYPFIKGTQIDYIDDKFNARIIFNNPNVKNACGCGESFSIDS